MDQTKWLKGFSRVWLSGAVLLAALGYSIEVGNYASHIQAGNVITINCSGTQKVRLTVCTPTIVKVDFDVRGTFASTQDMLSADFTTKNWGNPEARLTDKGTTLELATGKLLVEVQKTPIRLKYYDAVTNQLLTGDAQARGMSMGANVKPWIQLTKTATDHFFGWGQTMGWYKSDTVRIGLEKTNRKGYPDEYSEAPFMFSTGGYGIFCLFTSSTRTNCPVFDLTTFAAIHQRSSWIISVTISSPAITVR